MSNDFRVKNGLSINNTQIITGITDNSGLTNDLYTLPTMNAVKSYTDSKITIHGTNTQVLFNSGGTVTGSTKLTYDGTNLSVSGDTKTSYGLFSTDGAVCIKMINKTGSPTVKGKLVTYHYSLGNSFEYFPPIGLSNTPYIGITTEGGIPDGDYTYIAIYGRCKVLIQSGINLNDGISTFGIINDGDLVKDTGGWFVARALENGSSGDMIRCLLFNKDIQDPPNY